MAYISKINIDGEVRNIRDDEARIYIEEVQNDITEARDDLWEIRNVLSSLNLLHNWDFRNPVNQKGLLEYTAKGYMIDRWYLDGNLAKLSVMDGYCRYERMSGTATNTLMQKIEFPEKYSGKQITFSIEYKTSHSAPGIQLYVRANNASVGGGAALSTSDDWKTASITRTLPENMTSFEVWIYCSSGSAIGGYVDISRAKLELGTVSTLANDAPADYGVELAKCQRHMFVPQSELNIRASIFTGANYIWFYPVTPVPMRATPTIAEKTPQLLTLQEGALTGESSVFTVTRRTNANMLQVRCEKPNHGLNDAVLRIVPGTIFDANL